MNLTSEWISIPAEQGTPLPTYIVEPQAAREALPSVVVIHEIFGVDGHIRDVADRLAASGYRVLAPDLWSLGGERPPAANHERLEMLKRFIDVVPPGGLMKPDVRDAALAKFPPAEANQLRETMGHLFAIPRETFPLQVRHVLAHARRNGRAVGTVGFCLGGGVSAQLAFREEAPNAAVDYYGMAPGVDRANEVRCPVLALVADSATDPQITGAALAMAERLPGRFFTREYKGALHAFNNDTRGSYNASAARDAWARTLAFFADRL